VIIDAYRVLIDKYFPKDSVIFAGLATAMRYAGPREAVFHAIIRKNYGCTHFIVGRDHAGVWGFYGKYDAHKIFEHFHDLGITPLLLREPYYCRRCQEMVSDKICPHSEKWQVQISGTLIRKAVMERKELPECMMRKEVFAILKKAGKNAFI
jgi:sulfate adenylyltransferase